MPQTEKKAAKPRKPKKPTHGGKRPGAGRPAPDGIRKAHTVQLNPKEIAFIREKYGSLTGAVRSLIPTDPL